MAGDRLDLGTARNRLPNMSLNPLNRSVGVRLRGGGGVGERNFSFFSKYPKISSACRHFLSRIYSAERLSYFAEHIFSRKFKRIYYFLENL